MQNAEYKISKKDRHLRSWEGVCLFYVFYKLFVEESLD